MAVQSFIAQLWPKNMEFRIFIRYEQRARINSWAKLSGTAVACHARTRYFRGGVTVGEGIRANVQASADPVAVPSRDIAAAADTPATANAVDVVPECWRNDAETTMFTTGTCRTDSRGSAERRS